jgi:hypothetical protein
MTMAPRVCPNCSADVPPNARVCPACGSDEKTGWSEDAGCEGLDLPDENFDYADFVEREFGGKRAGPPRGISIWWWLVSLVVAAAFIWLLIR